MCDCFSSTPLHFSVTKYRKFGLTKSNWRPQNEPIPYIHIRNFPRLSKSHCRNPNEVSGPEEEEYGSYGELGFKEKGENSSDGDETASSGLNILELKGSLADGKNSKRGEESVEQSELVEVRKMGLRKGRQMMRRSNIVAKQVISIRSALSLGFVSELWVDTTSWVVLFVQVRPSLLSGESESFLLEDVSQVGDVVLIQDESVMENEFKMVGLETLVSTYALFVEDVLEVIPDAVVVHEAAASRIQRLTKGFLGTQNVGTSVDELGEYADFDKPAGSEYSRSIRRYGNQRFPRRNSETEDDWELPMDYL
ncbi:uncharacterized protein LOC132189696 isoform X3 [Corylus avellana]|uniref:uncharacterized protein LOC132189696 isoform X3 n=1 Tax=Corylus avellana TaxID=13451 RepID=UPI00286D20A8|nr:uncharacterized protein LOC132189696 isoform X3 [Corylus avellana]